MPLCAQLDVEQFLQIDVTSEPEAQVTYLIENAGAQIESYLDRTVEAATGIIETLDGIGQHVIRLKDWPVNAMTSIVEDGVTLTITEDYLWYPNGIVRRMSGDLRISWAFKDQGVVITYEAGYATVPFTIRDVCARMVARAFQAGAAYANTPTGAEGIKKLSLDGSDSVEYSDAVRDVTMAAIIIRDDEKQSLNRYRRQLVG